MILKEKRPDICVTEISFQAQYQAIVMSTYWDNHFAIRPSVRKWSGEKNVYGFVPKTKSKSNLNFTI